MEPKIRLTTEERRAVEEFRKRHRTGVLAMLFTDVIASTDIKRRLGDRAGIEIIARHRSLVRDTLGSFKDAEEISTAGDSFFIVFIKPSDAVRFALRIQHRIRMSKGKTDWPLQVRIGIHVGEVFIQEEKEGRLERDILGTQVDMAWYVTTVAAGGQIMMTRSVFNDARAILRGEALAGLKPLVWMNHGLYSVKGIEEAVELCEVGEEELAPLNPPSDSPSARRAIFPEGEVVLGWRPALDQVVPGSQWILDKKLGEGGFGEVWRARHLHTSESRVFKFCFRADQLRNFKRELTLFRILKEVLGERPDIARLHDVQFAEAPYYLELEYTPGGDLTEWIETRGGFENVPMELRLEIVAQIAAALSAAHSVGVIHKDVKPSNVLIEEKPDRSVQIRLTDFGIGQLTDRTALDRAGITSTGFTDTAGSHADMMERLGTRLYMAPELIAGRTPSIQSDIYSLGVLFYQMMVSDLSEPVVTDWERRVEDSFLREDLKGCLAGDPADRYASADELADLLRTHEQRREQHARMEAEKRAALRRRRNARILSYSAGVLLVIAVVSVYALYRYQKALSAEREQYHSAIVRALWRLDLSRFDVIRQILPPCPQRLRNWEWGRLLYLSHLDLRTFEGHTKGVNTVAASPNGELMATGGADGTLKIWEIDTGTVLHTFKAHEGPIHTVAFHPSGNLLATGGEDSAIRFWNTESGREEGIPLKEHTRAVTSVAFSKTGRYLASGSHDTKAMLWDLESKDKPRVFEAKSGRVWSVALSPDGKYLAAGVDDKSVRIWDLGTGQLLKPFDALEDQVREVRAVAFSHNSRYVAMGGVHGDAGVWDVVEGREVKKRFQAHPFPRGVTSAAFGFGDRFWVTGSSDKTAKIWDLETGGEDNNEYKTLTGHSGVVTAVAFVADGQQILTGSGDATAKLWHTERLDERLISQSEDSPVLAAAFSADSRILATGHFDGRIRFWDTQTRCELPTLHAVGGGVYTIAFDRGGRRLAAGQLNGSVTVWDTETAQEIKTFQPHAARVSSVAFGPNGKYLATASGHRSLSDLPVGDQNAYVLDIDGDSVTTLTGRAEAEVINCVAFSPDGTRVATGGWDPEVRLWDPQSGRCVRVLSMEEGEILSMAFSPNGRLLATAHGNGTVLLWDIKGGSYDRLKGHVGIVHSVDFSPDGTRLVTCGADGAAVLWDVNTRREVQILGGHVDEVRAASFSPDGRLLATGGIDERIVLRASFPWRTDDYETGGDRQLRDKHIRQYKYKYWDMYIAATREKPPIAHAHRMMDMRTYRPGSPIHVCLELGLQSDAATVTVVENFPAGWAVSGVSNNGFEEGHSIRWNLASVSAPKMTLTYTITPPETSTFGPAVFKGAIVHCPVVRCRIQDTVLARHGVMTFQDGTLPNPQSDRCSDTHVLIHFENNNTGGCRHLEEGGWPGVHYKEMPNNVFTDHKKILIRFDLSSVPSTTVVERAELRLYAFSERNLGCRNEHTLYVSRILKPWGEGTQITFDGDAAKEGDATFVSARYRSDPSSGIAWDKPGALGLGDVADPESSATVGLDWPAWVRFDVTESVRDIVAGRAPDYGWKISQDPEPGPDDGDIGYVPGIYMYKSSESPNVHLRPMLLIVTSGLVE